MREPEHSGPREAEASRVDTPSAASVVDRLLPKWTAPIPAQAVVRATLLLADYVGAAIAGSAEAEQVTARRHFLSGANRSGRCTVFGEHSGADAGTAAYLNASAGTAAELDDRLPEARAHVGIHAIPVALALTEAEGASGRDLIRAIAMGYEAAEALGDCFQERPAWLHPHGYWTSAAGAVAGAAVKRLDPSRLIDLINCALIAAPRLPFAAAWEGATIRNFYAGLGVTAAMQALEFAEAGISAPAQALQFIRARTGNDAVGMRAGARPGYAVERATFKFLPVCFSLHAIVYAVRQLKARVPADRIQQITVTGPEPLASFMLESPRNNLARRFNLRFSIAEELAYGLDPSGVLHAPDQAIANLAAKVTLVISSDTAAVSVRTIDGQSFHADVPQAVPYPAADNLASEVKEKFHAAVGPHLDSRRATQLWDYLASIDSAERVDLRPLI